MSYDLSLNKPEGKKSYKKNYLKHLLYVEISENKQIDTKFG